MSKDPCWVLKNNKKVLKYAISHSLIFSSLCLWAGGMFSASSMWWEDCWWQWRLGVGVWMWLWGQHRTLLTCCVCQTHSWASWASDTKYMLWGTCKSMFDWCKIIQIELFNYSNLHYRVQNTLYDWISPKLYKNKHKCFLNSFFCILQAKSIARQKLKRLYFTERC